MQRRIYSSSESDSLLKSVGPRRQKTTDLSFSGLIEPQHKNATIEFTKGTFQIYDPGLIEVEGQRPVFVLPADVSE